MGNSMSSKNKPKNPKTNDYRMDFNFSPVRQLTGAARDLAETYTTVQNGRVHRAELQRNGEAMRNTVPAVKAFVETLTTNARRRDLRNAFHLFLTAANTIAYWVDVLTDDAATKEIGKLIHGELEAHTGLDAPRKFARQVDKTIREQIASAPSPGSTADVFFLYHPDTDWHGEFFSIVKGDPLPANFMGMSDNLDAIVLWMLWLRQQRICKSLRHARFHLLVPAYRPTLVKDPLIFPEGLYPLTIRGLVHNSRPLVWFDLPTIKDVPPELFELHNVGNLANPPSAWQRPLSAAAGVAVGAAGLGLSMLATTAAAPVIGPAAGLVWLGAGGGSLMAAGKVAEKIGQQFDNPAPRLIGEPRDRRGRRGGEEGPEEEFFTLQRDMRKVSRRTRQRDQRRRGGGRNHR